ELAPGSFALAAAQLLLRGARGLEALGGREDALEVAVGVECRPLEARPRPVGEAVAAVVVRVDELVARARIGQPLEAAHTRPAASGALGPAAVDALSEQQRHAAHDHRQAERVQEPGVLMYVARQQRARVYHPALVRRRPRRPFSLPRAQSDRAARA